MWNSVVTNAGIALLARWAEGGTLAITGAKAGTGTTPTAQLMAATNVSGTAIALSIVRYSETTDGIEYLVQIQSAASAYIAKQIGIFASLDGGPNTLIAIYQTDGAGIEVPSYTEMSDFSIQFAAAVQMSNTGTMTVSIDPTAYVTIDTLDDAVEHALENVLTTSDVANDLTTTSAGKVLDARQGKALKDAIDNTYTQNEVDALLSEKADQSDTYTKSEVDTAVSAKCSVHRFTVTLPTAGWSLTGGLYRIVMSVPGIQAADQCGGIGPVQIGDEAVDKPVRKAWDKIVRMEAGADSVIAWALKLPTVAIPVQMEIFR